jgi:HD-GYP domain-containing protein (c-di-GMP phosphodiesterase class II)
MVRGLAQDILRVARNKPDATLAAILLLPFRRYSCAHAVHVALLVLRVAIRLKTPMETTLCLVCSALTMNISMQALQDQLRKQEQPLTDQQLKRIRFHPVIGSAILREAGVVDPLWHVSVLGHHERFNGKGYPFGLGEQKINYYAHLIHVADTVMAWLHPARSPHTPFPKDQVLRLFACRDVLVDRQIADCIVKEIGLYPAGCFVKVNDGSTAIVLGPGPDLDHPVCMRVSRDGMQPQEALQVVGPIDAGEMRCNVAALARLWECHYRNPHLWHV